MRLHLILGLYMKKLALCALLSLGALTPAMAQTTTTPTPMDQNVNAAPMQRNNDTDHSSWGWLGLLGLAGLAGFAKRDNKVQRVTPVQATR